jgi:2-oxo-4-hydroxy-4-carboxy-5-ureidoimidazoline decarboxylase
MLRSMPFTAAANVFDAAELGWWVLVGDEQDRSKDWKEAFSHHPKVGADVLALARQAPGQRNRLEVERAGLAGASEETLQELAQLHREYDEKFGFAFLICATRGKSADQMLAALKARMPNDPALELKVAAAEQAKLTYLRLEKLELAGLEREAV